MGQKVNPISLRLGINKTWDSRWFADGEYATLLHEDLCIARECQVMVVKRQVNGADIRTARAIKVEFKVGESVPRVLLKRLV